MSKKLYIRDKYFMTVALFTTHLEQLNITLGRARVEATLGKQAADDCTVALQLLYRVRSQLIDRAGSQDPNELDPEFAAAEAAMMQSTPKPEDLN